jgi:cell division cycle protein 37
MTLTQRIFMDLTRVTRSRWKQRDVHDKREQRKQKIARLRAELEMNAVLEPRLAELAHSTKDEGVPFFERQVGQLREKPSNDKPQGSTGPSYDEMVLSLLVQISDAVKEKGVDKDALPDELVKRIEEHRVELIKRTEEVKNEIAADEAEMAKHITSEDLHEGWNSAVSVSF